MKCDRSAWWKVQEGHHGVAGHFCSPSAHGPAARFALHGSTSPLRSRGRSTGLSFRANLEAGGQWGEPQPPSQQEVSGHRTHPGSPPHTALNPPPKGSPHLTEQVALEASLEGSKPLAIRPSQAAWLHVSVQLQWGKGACRHPRESPRFQRFPSWPLWLESSPTSGSIEPITLLSR